MTPGPPPREGRLVPPGPRWLADVAAAAVALVVLGLPSLAFAQSGWNPAYLLFGVQHYLGSVTSEAAVEAVRIAVNVAAALGMPLAVAWRAAKPVASTTAVAALALAHFLTGTLLLPVDLLIFLSLYSLTIYGPSPADKAGMLTALTGGGLVSASLASGVGAAASALATGGLLFTLSAALVLLAWGAGLLRRSRLEQRESLRERARRLERERDQQAQIAAVAERNRIAREMHDIVAHSLSVVVAQADGGRYAAAADPHAATTALETIADTSRAALSDMRRILGVLREGNGTAADLTPQPAETNIDALIAQTKAAGLHTSRVSLGSPRALPAGAGAALYRITQEALTNVLKHAGPGARAVVTTHWDASGLTITVEDDGRGAAARQDRPGYGIVGMRERATMLGGSLTAGPKPGGGFRVRLYVPLPGGDPAPEGSGSTLGR